MNMSTKRFLVASACTIALGSMAGSRTVAGQSKAAATPPDLTGLWDGAPGGSTRDLAKYMKAQGLAIPFTPLGAERYKKVDMAKNPNAYCLPPGPSRALTGPSPFFIVQHNDVVSFNYENHGLYRVVYINGKHTAAIADRPP